MRSCACTPAGTGQRAWGGGQSRGQGRLAAACGNQAARLCNRLQACEQRADARPCAGNHTQSAGLGDASRRRTNEVGAGRGGDAAAGDRHGCGVRRWLACRRPAVSRLRWAARVSSPCPERSRRCWAVSGAGLGTLHACWALPGHCAKPLASLGSAKGARASGDGVCAPSGALLTPCAFLQVQGRAICASGRCALPKTACLARLALAWSSALWRALPKPHCAF